MTGRLIAIEGPNAVGKTTIVGRLATALRAHGVVVHVTTEPSATPLGRLVRSAESYLTGRALALAVAADRYAHLEGEISPKRIGQRVRVLQDLTAEFAAVSVPCRPSAAVLDTGPAVSVIGVYVPSRDRSADKTERKERFIRTFVEACDKLPEDLREHLVLGGDYNVIGRTHRPLHPGFLPFEFGLLEGLSERGLVDAYDCVAPGEQAYSWIGRTGDGYRYDYLHVGPGLAGLIGTSSYLHETR